MSRRVRTHNSPGGVFSTLGRAKQIQQECVRNVAAHQVLSSPASAGHFAPANGAGGPRQFRQSTPAIFRKKLQPIRKKSGRSFREIRTDFDFDQNIGWEGLIIYREPYPASGGWVAPVTGAGGPMASSTNRALDFPEETTTNPEEIRKKFPLGSIMGTQSGP